MTIKEHMEVLMSVAKVNLLADKHLTAMGLVVTRERQLLARPLQLANPDDKAIEQETMQLLIRGFRPYRAIVIFDGLTKPMNPDEAEKYANGDLAKDTLATECICVSGWENWEVSILMQHYLRDKDDNISFVGEPVYHVGGESAFFPKKEERP